MSGLFTGHDPTGGSDQELFVISRVESSRINRCLESHGLDRFGSDRVVLGQVGLCRIVSGCVGLCRVVSGRVGSCRVVSSRVGSCRVRSGRRSGRVGSCSVAAGGFPVVPGSRNQKKWKKLTFRGG